MISKIWNSARRILPISLPVVLLTVFLLMFAVSSPAGALPEYAARTHEPCATCHISPGGGGPLTLRGLSWVGNGKPDVVPKFEDVLLAPGVSDAEDLYEIACSACHGIRGEGLAAPGLAGYDFSKVFIRRIVTDGETWVGMPAFGGQFTETQLAALAAYVSNMSAGRVVPQSSYPLPEGHLGCSGPGGSTSNCGGN